MKHIPKDIGVDTIEPFHQNFSLDDKTIQYPFAEHERVPMWLAAIIDVVIPFVIIAACSLMQKNLHDWHHASLGLMLCLTLTLAVTDFFKTFAGRPRPDFINRCDPLPGSVDAKPYGLSNWTICQQTDKVVMKDGFKSFISGHSSISFAGLGFLTFYLAGKLRVFDRKGHAYKSFVVFFPLGVAAYIAVTRTEDCRHHWQDVVTGGLIGFFLAFFAYHQYYPPLYSYKAGAPLPVRLKPHAPEHRAEFTFNDGATFEVHVVRNDGSSILQGIKTLQSAINNDDNEVTHQIV
ncbi:15641_t:CDS:2 [Cetraspora pellucida]|uniref:15641_t:CDS:1 n=1 Tax=Cetraspora pellucida TaxID=1433469 RepID=A0ACA9K085_9GLOM|nr:15641_t:CDS:2 [Cetraspora pellucida]